MRAPTTRRRWPRSAEARRIGELGADPGQQPPRPARPGAGPGCWRPVDLQARQGGGRHLRAQHAGAGDRGAGARATPAGRTRSGSGSIEADRRPTAGGRAGLGRPPRGSRSIWSRKAPGRSISRSGSAPTPRSSPRPSPCPRSGTAPRSASTRARPGTIPSPSWCWWSAAAGGSSAPRSATTSTCATSRGAARCCWARPRTTTRPARSARSSGCSTGASGSTRCARAEVGLDVEGEDDGFRLAGTSSMGEISRDVDDLVGSAIGAYHQYPDGFVLFCGTMFAPTEDRGAAGPGLHPQARRPRGDQLPRARHARQPGRPCDAHAALGLRHRRSDAQPRRARPACAGA